MKIWILLLLMLGGLWCRAQTPAGDDEPVTTIVQSGHLIQTLDVSADQKYALTSDGRTIALWNLERRRILKLITQPNRDVRFHPLHASWMMVRPVNGFDGAGLADQGDEAVYYTYDLFTGKRLGVRKGKDLLARNLQTDLFLLERREGVVRIRSRKTGAVIGVLDGHQGLSAARIALNDTDSLLMQSGLRPLIWDLKNARFLRRIPYVDFLKKDSTLYFRDDYTVPLPRSQVYKIRRNDFQYGYRSFYEGFFTDRDEILLGGYNANITRWSVDGRLLGCIPTDGAPVFSFADNGRWRVAATYGGLNMGPMPDGRLTDCRAFNEASRYKLLYQISPVFRRDFFVTGGDDGDLLMGRLGSPDFRKRLLFVDMPPMCYDVDASEQTILLSGELARLQEVPIDRPEANLCYNTSAFKGARTDCCLYLDREWIAAGSNDGVVGFWKRGVGDPQQVVLAHRNGVADLKLTHDGKWLISADLGGMLRVWDAATRTPIADFHHLGVEDDYVVITPDNYYKASKGAYDKIHFVRGMQVLSFEQFDLVYNRPDIVLQRLGQPESKTRLYRLAWQKRLRRMGYTEAMLSGEIHAPELTVTNRQSVPASTAQRTITLAVRAEDSKYGVSRLFVSLNGVPLYGRRGLDLGGEASVCERSLELDLCRGNNRIDLSCMNDKGVESYREQIEVYCEAEPVRPRLFLAAVGVSRYARPGFDLNYAAKDAADFAGMMKRVCGERFASVETMVLTDEAFSVESLPQLRRFFGEAGRDDVVMLFYAGHGVLNRDLDYFLGTYALDFEAPERRGVSYEAFESCLEATQSVHRFCFVDACHSGELDKEDYLADNVVVRPVGKLVFRNAGQGLREIEGVGLSEVRTLFNELFVDVRWGVGATVLSSAGGMEVALEGSDWKNGLFTWCLKRGILQYAADLNDDGKVSMGELTEYVSREVNRLSDGLQTPGVRQVNRLQDYVIVESTPEAL